MVSGSPCPLVSFLDVYFSVIFVVRGQRPSRGLTYGRASEPKGRASEQAGRALDPIGRASEQARRAPEEAAAQGEPRIKLGGP